MHFHAVSAAPVMSLLDWTADSRSKRSLDTAYDRANLGVASGMLATGQKVGERCEKPTKWTSGRFLLGDAQSEELLQGPAKCPVAADRTEAIEVGFTHVAVKHELMGLSVEMNPVLEVIWKFNTVREPVQFDEVIHGTLHQSQARGRTVLDPNGIEQHGDLGAEIEKLQPSIAPGCMLSASRRITVDRTNSPIANAIS